MSLSDLQPVPTDQLVFRLPQKFETLAEERRHRQERLAAALRLFGRFGFEEGVAGHITVRDPEHTDHFWVNPFGMSFKHIKVSDLILVNHEGTGGRGPLPRQPGRVRDPLDGPPGHGRTWSPPRTATRCTARRCRRSARCWSRSPRTRARSTRTTPSSTTTPVSCSRPRRASRIAQTLGSHKAVILRNHGLLTVGDSVDAAAWWFITMERSCQAQLLAKAAGPTVPDQPRERQAHPRPDRQRHGRLDQLPAAVRPDHRRSEPDLFD